MEHRPHIKDAVIVNIRRKIKALFWLPLILLPFTRMSSKMKKIVFDGESANLESFVNYDAAKMEIVKREIVSSLHDAIKQNTLFSSVQLSEFSELIFKPQLKKRKQEIEADNTVENIISIIENMPFEVHRFDAIRIIWASRQVLFYDKYNKQMANFDFGDVEINKSMETLITSPQFLSDLCVDIKRTPFLIFHERKEIDEAIQLYKYKHYKACIMMLFSIIDTRVMQFNQRINVNKSFNTRGISNIIKEFQKTPNWTEDMCYAEAIKIVSSMTYANAGNFEVAPSCVNRNWIMHRIDMINVNAYDVCKILLLYYNLLGMIGAILYPMYYNQSSASPL